MKEVEGKKWEKKKRRMARRTLKKKKKKKKKKKRNNNKTNKKKTKMRSRTRTDQDPVVQRGDNFTSGIRQTQG